MQILTNVSLRNYSTMRLGGAAAALTEITSKDELLEALAWAESRQLPVLVLGGGSNVIFSDGYEGLVIINRIPGFSVIKKDGTIATITIGAGENWDNAVERTVKLGLSGIEKLSLIPGTAGATPVQNVGAYGAEIADVFVELEAYDMQAKQFVTLKKADCNFTYRNSIFKSLHNRRYIITNITLQLTTGQPTPPFYEVLQRYLDDHDIHDYSSQTIRNAVIAIRTSKLPNPALIANTGSFFKNPIIPADQFSDLDQRFPGMPHWPTQDGKVKIPAGWLIDQADLKGYQAHGMKIYEKNALVFVNDSAKNYADLAAFRQEIIDKVHAKFGVTLEQEPELI